MKINDSNNLIRIELKAENKSSSLLRNFESRNQIDQIFFSDDGRFRPVAGQFSSVGRFELGAIGYSTEATSAPSQRWFLELVGQLNAKKLPKASVTVLYSAEIQMLQPEQMHI